MGNGKLIAGPRELAPFAGDARRADEAVSRRIDSGPENAEQTFGLTDEDLDLDLGPLGRLL